MAHGLERPGRDPAGRQSTMSWAATIPYRDGGFQCPPSRTLEALPPEGIVLVVTLEQHGRPSGDATIPPLSDFLQGSFAGVPADNATRRFNAPFAALQRRDVRALRAKGPNAGTDQPSS